MELYASVNSWAEHIDRQIDFEKIIGCLDKTSRTVIAMRLQEHEWQLIGDKKGGPQPLYGAPSGRIYATSFQDWASVTAAVRKERKHEP